MVERTQVELEARDMSDSTLPHWAALKDNVHVVQYLCEQGGDNDATSKYGRTPLYSTAEKGHRPVVQHLCEQGANKEARNSAGMAPLHYARRGVNPRVCLHVVHHILVSE